ncbi:hypothetical protein EYZ11_005376 [Aspergillus tanneri]|uniref:Uncharacterized protein n=1 Tax=Aspergillus tanneri TaxID=1220188 RepID=A0A4S3JIA8_9EURO|nr:hypothetical protein EYZ11_005376 [Aspergillus tanneri]
MQQQRYDGTSVCMRRLQMNVAECLHTFLAMDGTVNRIGR